MLDAFLKPWWQSLDNPEEAQEAVLNRLLSVYQQTRYGMEHGADKISSIEQFRASFPVVTYGDLKPLISTVMEGDFGALLPEPPIEWAMTRGTTGESKLVPITKADLAQRVNCGPRALLSYVHRSQSYDTLAGWDLNLNFPSVVGKKFTLTGEITYGYSSGIYAKHSAREAKIKMAPEQDEIDALGGGTATRDWENRFDLTYEKAKDKNVTMLIGVIQTMIQFASYLKRRKGIYPKDLWNIDVLVCTSLADIHTKHKMALKGLYGDAAVTEMYGATEGLYAQQLDNQPYVVPNYDTYFFEVEIGWEVKMLHELKTGQYGSLIISSCLFPRYKIGDLIRCMDKNYYCVIGRDKRFTLIRHLLSRLLDF